MNNGALNQNVPFNIPNMAQFGMGVPTNFNDMSMNPSSQNNNFPFNIPNDPMQMNMFNGFNMNQMNQMNSLNSMNMENFMPFNIPNNFSMGPPSDKKSKKKKSKKQPHEKRRKQKPKAVNTDVEEDSDDPPEPDPPSKSKLDEITLDEFSDDDSFGEDMKRIKSSTGDDVYLQAKKQKKFLESDNSDDSERTKEKKLKDLEKKRKNQLKKQKRREKQKQRKAEMKRQMEEKKKLVEAQLKLQRVQDTLNKQETKKEIAEKKRKKAEKKRRQKDEKQKKLDLEEAARVEKQRLKELEKIKHFEKEAESVAKKTNLWERNIDKEDQQLNVQIKDNFLNKTEIIQPKDLEDEFVYEYEEEFQGDELTRGDYDDIVNVIRNNIGEGAFVNENDYIGIQYMNDLVLVQSFIDKKLELQIAAESDLAGKINIHNRQDFPNFDPGQEPSSAKKKSQPLTNPIQNKLNMQEALKKKEKSEFIVVKKGRKRGKKKNDPEREYKAFMQKDNGGFDFGTLDNFAYEPEYGVEEEEDDGIQKNLQQNFDQVEDIPLGYDSKDYVTDEAEYQKILEKLMKETAVGGPKSETKSVKSDFDEAQFLRECAKKKENPISNPHAGPKKEENPDYLTDLYGTHVPNLYENPVNQKKRAAFDIGKQIEQMDEQRKTKSGGKNQWSSMAEDYLLSVSKDSEDLLLSLHSIFPRLGLGRLKMFFSLLGESFDLTKSFLMRKKPIFINF